MPRRQSDVKRVATPPRLRVRSADGEASRPCGRPLRHTVRRDRRAGPRVQRPCLPPHGQVKGARGRPVAGADGASATHGVELAPVRGRRAVGLAGVFGGRRTQAQSVNGRGGGGAWRPRAHRRRTRQAPELAGVARGLGAWAAWSGTRAATHGRGLCAHPRRWTGRRGRPRGSDVRAPAGVRRCARPERRAPAGARSNCRSWEPHFKYRHTRPQPARTSRRRGRGPARAGPGASSVNPPARAAEIVGQLARVRGRTPGLPRGAGRFEPAPPCSRGDRRGSGRRAGGDPCACPRLGRVAGGRHCRRQAGRERERLETSCSAWVAGTVLKAPSTATKTSVTRGTGAPP